jgi:UDP-N-acetylmuramoyl-tripeptide--D-alanyl-D-alanine ligase
MQIDAIYQIYKNHPVISIDNRKVEPGCIFVGIKGEKFDGNGFAKLALEAGAAYAIIDNKEFYIDERTILVNDSLTTLQELAKLHRRSFDIPFIAICGSNGKTTTKELTYAVLSTTFKAFATKGNLNNHIGVPLTILSIPTDTEIAIIEIGANHLQETYDLCEIAEPNFGLITNNGKDHLEGFGSIENVIQANGELFKWLKKSVGTAFVNYNYSDLIAASSGLSVVSYGSAENSTFVYKNIHGVYASIQWGKENLIISSQLFGDFNGDNIATAVIIGKHFNVPMDKIKQAIENYKPGMNRSQILNKDQVTYFIDCYNANPSSMKLAIDSFIASAQSPRAVILADMLELGEHSEREHALIVDQIKQADLNMIVLIGKYFGMMKGQVSCIHFEKTEEAQSWFKEQNFTGWSILLKGSRGYALEKLINF